jgi:hypothetical protein
VKKKNHSQISYQFLMLSLVILSMVIGSFCLAWVDGSTRHTFIEMVKAGIGNYITVTILLQEIQRQHS